MVFVGCFQTIGVEFGGFKCDYCTIDRREDDDSEICVGRHSINKKMKEDLVSSHLTSNSTG